MITTKGGLLYDNNKLVGLPTADLLARKYDLMYAEHLVKKLEDNQNFCIEFDQLKSTNND